ncbi:MAG: adenosylcobinamide-phosphate synthase CbiB [Heliobacteriaceae bacterium]|nr:adenosylcobinamide-phosphate synthase CbiB [Heliobacteriaceae bacterium]
MLVTSFATGAGIIFLAIIWDLVFGDPDWLPHPVVGIGKMITVLEKRLYPPPGVSGAVTFARGMILAVTVILVVFGVVAAVLDGFAALNQILAQVLAVVLLGVALAGRSLAQAALEIKSLLLAGDLPGARQKLAYIVGRDTGHLTEPEIVRATVETVAENIVDGITSPLFFALVAGVPGAWAYKAVNTLDSMVGYRNQRYRWFGCFAARLDDVANFIPARLTGLVMLVAAILMGYRPGQMLRAWRQDAPKHPSPNSGITEAIMAGALGVQLGGVNYYGGVPSRRSYLGQALRPLTPRCIADAVCLMNASAALFGISGVIIMFLVGK